MGVPPEFSSARHHCEARTPRLEKFVNGRFPPMADSASIQVFGPRPFASVFAGPAAPGVPAGGLASFAVFPGAVSHTLSSIAFPPVDCWLATAPGFPARRFFRLRRS
jgi:hypothetical protein